MGYVLITSFFVYEKIHCKIRENYAIRPFGNFIVNNKLSKAKDMQIDIKAEIENLSFSYMDSIDSSVLEKNPDLITTKEENDSVK